MDYAKVVEFVRSTFNMCAMNYEYYTNISSWLTWYKGYDPQFHTVITENGENRSQRTMYQLKMGKRVAEDWASAVSSEPPQIVVASPLEESSVFIQGSNSTTGVLGSNNFNQLLSLSLERMFALGTSANVIAISGVAVDAAGNIVDGHRCRIHLQSYDATRIIPLSVVNGEIVDCSFMQVDGSGDQQVVILTSHIREADGYVIYTHVLDNRYNSVSLPQGVLPVIRTKSLFPLFEVLRPNIANNIDLESPLGISVYANAIDNLKSTDQAFDACIRDVVTGQRIILMNKCLLKRAYDGTPVAPQDVKQTYMQFFGDETSRNIDEYIKEFTPKLNTADLDKELQNQLNMLSFKCGLGTHYYNFDRSGGLTATEYSGERQDFVRNVRKMNLSISNSIARMVRVMLFIGESIIGRMVDSSANIIVTMQDGIVEDDSKAMEMDLKLVEKGIMSKVEFRMKWMAESQEEAMRKLSLVLPVAT